MGLFRKKDVKKPNLFDEICKPLNSNEDDAYYSYCEKAQELPLLTDEELMRFCNYGKQTVVSNGGMGKTWFLNYDVQFLFRLRMTILEKLSKEEPPVPPNPSRVSKIG